MHFPLAKSSQRILEVEIERLVWQGRGLARDTDGRLIMVSPEVFPDEHVRIAISKEQKKLLFAQPLEILKPSAFRKKHLCPHFFAGCGGCRFGVIKSSYGLELKKNMLLDALKRNLALADIPEPKLMPNPSPWGYRYRGQLHIRKKQAYFSMAGKQDLVPISSCALLTPALEEKIPDLAKKLPDGRHCVAASPVTNDVRTEHENRPLDFSLLDFDIFWQQPAACFFQANWKLNAQLVQEVVAHLTEQERIADLFCGSGNFALPLAKQGATVLALEADPLAVKTGNKAAKKNKLTGRCSFIQANMLQSATWTSLQNFQPQALVLDPPRTGAPGIARYLLELTDLTRIIWVSCDAVTTCRDLKSLLQHGWNLQSIHLFDMFTQTWHMEVLFLLEK